MSTTSTYRSRDNLYALFLVSYVLTIIFFDNLPLYPQHLVPPQLLELHTWYKNYYNDQLLITQPPWFRFFSLSEPFYQLPVSIWSVWALTTKNPKAPTHLLVWAVVCCGTTLTCLFEFYHNTLMTDQEKKALFSMYGLYAAIFAGIGLDMFSRIQQILVAASTVQQTKKSQ